VSKPIAVLSGHIVIALLLLAPLARMDWAGGDGYPGIALILFGGLALVPVVAGLSYAAGFPPLTAFLDAALLPIALPWFSQAAADRTGSLGILSAQLLWSGALTGLLVIGFLLGLAGSAQWIIRKLRKTPQTP
jgi:hypothetical protein